MAIKAADKEKKAKDKAKAAPAKGSTTSFWADERAARIAGLTLVLLGLFLTVSLISYAFSWQPDQDKFFHFSWGLLLQNDPEIPNNMMGRFGAIISHQLYYYGFGIGSFFLVPVLMFSGLRLAFKLRFFSLWKVYRYAFLGLVWASVSLGLLDAQLELAFPLGGSFGMIVAQWLMQFIGLLGAVLVLFFSLLAFAIIEYNLDIQSWVNTGKTAAANKAGVGDKPQSFLDTETEVKEWAQRIKDENDKVDPLIPPFDMDESEEDEPEEEGSFDFEVKHVPPVKPVGNASKFDLEVESPSFEINETMPTPVHEPVEMDRGGLDTEYDPTLDLADYKYPPLDLLRVHGSERIQVDTDELEKNKNQIIETLSNYNIEISKIKATIGPTVTLYEIVPAAGVRISKIKNLEDDIALSLSALGIRIIAPIPGKGTIGIEVPNVKKEVVSMHTLISSEKFQTSKMELPVALGKTIANEIFIADLAKMPHMLMAGATGQGKSVGLNAMLVSLLYKKHPSQLKFVLVDPKKVELTLFAQIEKHFLAKLPGESEPIITDTKKVIHTLNALCIEMDNRYDLLKEAQVRNIKEYNAKFIARKLNPNKGHQYLPYIVLVVDEFADLMMTAGKEVETPIARLAQLARAIGIHLVIATQRPSVNIITGTIKANFPARVAFKVTSKIDSRTILDAGGADQLIGRGDMLLSDGGDIIRLQCGFVDTPEVEDICKYIGEQRGYPETFKLPEYVGEKDEDGGDLDAGDWDELFEEAARTIVQTQQGSTSLLQRRLKLGYNRAGRLMDQLERAGIVGPNEGSKAREVLYADMYQLEQFLNEHR
ncbi:MAG: DNA translocase FtsK [Chitinophagales bacterium]|nr:DNA translocase FtsK [Chitinophagales bacterium]